MWKISSINHHSTYDIHVSSKPEEKQKFPHQSVRVDTSSKQTVVGCILSYHLGWQKDKYRLLEAIKSYTSPQNIPPLCYPSTSYIKTHF